MALNSEDGRCPLSPEEIQEVWAQLSEHVLLADGVRLQGQVYSHDQVQRLAKAVALRQSLIVEAEWFVTVPFDESTEEIDGRIGRLYESLKDLHELIFDLKVTLTPSDAR